MRLGKSIRFVRMSMITVPNRVRKFLQVMAFVTLCFLPGLSLAQRPMPGETFVTVEHLKKVLQSKNLDLLGKTLNDVKGMANQSMILPFVKDLWGLRKDRHRDVPWDVAENDSIRLSFADILLQARRNGNIEFDPSDMVKFAAERLELPNFHVRISAAFVLGLSETDQAVEILFREARRQRTDTYRSATLALIHMCNPKSDRAVGDLKGLVKDRIRQKFLYESTEKWREFNRGHSWCRQSN